MFAENLLESGRPRRGRRAWTTAASLTVQAVVLSLFALIPMLYPDAISLLRPEPISIPMFSTAPPPPTNATHHSVAVSPTSSAQFIPVRDSSIHFGHARDSVEATTVPNVGAFIAGDSMPLIPTGRGPEVRLTPTEVTKPVRLSHMEPGSLVHNVLPIYPPPARQARIEGPVMLHAVISREGTIESLQVVSGHPFLARAALDAVRQWRYRPYVLNGQPVEVDTQITVNFTLGKN
jgi:periplasmic protein TonB